MVSIKDDVDFAKLKDNSIIGNPKLTNSVINFNGQNNILYCQNGVELNNAIINFNGNNSVIFLSSSVYSYPIKLHVFNNSIIFFGKNNHLHPFLRISVRESKNLLIGDGCFFGANVSIKTSDGVLLYDLNTKRRLNSPNDVYIGDNVFIGDGCHISGGCTIEPETVISDFSSLPSMFITKSNCYYEGNPVKLIYENIIFKDKYTGYFEESDIETYENYNEELVDNYYSHSYDKNVLQAVKASTSSEKLDYILNVFIPLKQKYNSDITDIDFSKYKLALRGLNHFYFLINDTNQELKQHFDERYTNNFDADQFINHLIFKNKIFSENDIKYYYFVVPDKSIVCKEWLPFTPNNIKRNIDLIPNFQDFSNVLLPKHYFKLDSHINYDGGLLLTFCFLNFMDDSFTSEIYRDLLKNAKFKDITHNFDFLTERNWSYSESEKLQYDLNHKYNIPLPKKFVDAFEEIPEEFNFDGVRKSEFFKNEDSFSSLRALIFRDSSANLLKGFFPFYFKETFFYWDHGHVNDKVIKWYKPDVIIELRTERLLDNIPTPDWVNNKRDIFQENGE